MNAELQAVLQTLALRLKVSRRLEVCFLLYTVIFVASAGTAFN